MRVRQGQGEGEGDSLHSVSCRAGINRHGRPCATKIGVVTTGPKSALGQPRGRWQKDERKVSTKIAAPLCATVKCTSASAVRPSIVHE